MKIVVIGGGSSYTPELIEGFIKRHESLPVSEIWLVDIEEGKEKLEIITGLARRMVEKSDVSIAIHSTMDRREALKGADFVTTQIRVGQLDARLLDETIPLKYGALGQETNGAGGMFKAFRTIPVLLDIARDIEELCPEAWLINFTNPAGMVTEALTKYSNHKKVIGLCNVPIHMKKNIAALLDVHEDELRVDFAGLNHMVFATDVILNDKNIMHDVIEKMIEEKNKNLSMKNVADLKYEDEFLRALGVIHCPYHNYYFKKQEMLSEELDHFAKNEIRAEVVKKIEAELFEKYKNPNLDMKPPELEKRGGAYYSDAACSLIDSLYNDRGDIQTVNVMNNGAISQLPDDTVIETSCYIRRSGPTPIKENYKLPMHINGLIQSIKSFELATIDAAIKGDYRLALLALCINPLTPSDTIAKKIVNEMFEAHKEYLPQFK